MYNCKNYSKDNGDTWVIGGKLEVLDGATVNGIVPSATEVEAIATPGSATAEACATKINAIISALQAAGLMEVSD